MPWKKIAPYINVPWSTEKEKDNKSKSLSFAICTSSSVVFTVDFVTLTVQSMEIYQPYHPLWVDGISAYCDINREMGKFTLLLSAYCIFSFLFPHITILRDSIGTVKRKIRGTKKKSEIFIPGINSIMVTLYMINRNSAQPIKLNMFLIFFKLPV